MKILISILISTIIFSIDASAQQPVKEKYVYHDTLISKFDKITLSSGINVIYSQNADSAQIVKIYCPADKTDAVKMTVKDGNLHIRYSKIYNKDFGVIVVYVFSRELTDVNCSGGGVFSTNGYISGAFINLKVTGDSQIRCTNIEYDSVKARRGIGQGDLLLSGKTNNAEFSILGRGEINAENLVANKVKCRIFGLGDIGCNVNESIEVSGVGRGAAYCKGRLNISGKSSKIRAMPE